MRLLRALFLALPFATAAIAQTPIPTVLFAEHPVATPAATDSTFPGFSAVASNGANFLVVTAMDRFFSGYLHALMLVDSDGHPLLDASYTTGGCGNVDGVASNGRDYLAVFGCRGGTDAVLFFSDGVARPLTLHAKTRSQMTSHDTSGMRSVAWDGSQYVVLSTTETVVTQPLGISYQEIATRVSPTGDILQNDLVVGGNPASVIAARNGVSVIASWSAALSVRTMNTPGVLSDPVAISPNATNAATIADGADGFLLVWAEAAAVRGQHLDPSGHPAAPPFTIAVATASEVTVTAETSVYRVAWTDAGGVINSARVNASGGVAMVNILTNGVHPVVRSNGTSTLLAWQSTDAPTASTRAKNADAAGKGQLVHRLTNAQTLDAIGFTAAGPTVAWSEGTSRLTNLITGISSAPLSDGSYSFLRGLDRPLIISGTKAPYTVRYADAPDASFPVPSANLFWTGSGFLAIWTDAAPAAAPLTPLPLYAQRFDTNGNVLDPAPREMGTSLDLRMKISGAAALYSGVFAGASSDEVLVAYVDTAASLQGVLLKGDQITPIGEIASPQALANPIAITSDGRDFLVTWISGMNGSNSFIASRRVLSTGEMPDPIRIDSPGNDRKDAMATFWAGQNYLVVWSTTNGNGDHDLSAIRIAADGALLDYPPRHIGTITGLAPQFACKDGVLAIAYVNANRVYWRFVTIPRARAVRRP